MLPALLAPSVRLLVGWHVRTKLKELAQVYGQLRGAAPEGANEAAWLTAARDQATSCRDSIPTFRIRATLALLPSLIGFTPKLLGSPSPFATLIALVALVYLVAILGGIVALNGSRAFALKRDIFLERMRFESAQINDGETESRSIYELENRLFSVLRRPKRKEPRLDAWLPPGYLIAIAIAYATALIVALKEPNIASVTVTEGMVLAVLASVALVLGLVRAARRRSRPR